MHNHRWTIIIYQPWFYLCWAESELEDQVRASIFARLLSKFHRQIEERPSECQLRETGRLNCQLSTELYIAIYDVLEASSRNFFWEAPARYSFYCLHRSAIKNGLLPKNGDPTSEYNRGAIRILRERRSPAADHPSPKSNVSNSILQILIEMIVPLGRGETSARNRLIKEITR